MSKITSISQLDLNGYYTYKDYMTWLFQDRVELIKGLLLKMSPAPNRRHQRLSGRLFLIIGNHLQNSSCEIFAAPFDVRLPVSRKAGEKDTVVQPDLVVICDPYKLDEQGCNGAPDIVVEILSPGNSEREMKIKFDLYEESLVPEYWIVDPIHEDIVVYRLGENQKYFGSRPYVSGDVLTTQVLPGLNIDVSQILEE